MQRSLKVNRNEALEDLAYVRTLAEAGHVAPLLGGGHLAAFGTLTALAYIGHYAVLTGPMPTYMFAVLWGGYGVAMAGAAWLLERRVRGKPGQGAVGNRVERAVWFSAGLAIFAVFLGSAGRAIATQDGAAMDLLAPTVFAAYATGLMTTGRIVDDRLLIGAAVVAYCVAILAVLLLFTPTLYLVVAGGALVTLAAPGFVLMRREPSEIV